LLPLYRRNTPSCSSGLATGEELAVISKMLGHADYSTTVDVYSHLSAERSKVAAARIDALLKRPRGRLKRKLR
jgi:integrase